MIVSLKAGKPHRDHKRRTDEAGALELLYNLYEARIRGYQKNPPPEDWSGAFALLTK